MVEAVVDDFEAVGEGGGEDGEERIVVDLVGEGDEEGFQGVLRAGGDAIGAAVDDDAELVAGGGLEGDKVGVVAAVEIEVEGAGGDAARVGGGGGVELEGAGNNLVGGGRGDGDDGRGGEGGGEGVAGEEQSACDCTGRLSIYAEIQRRSLILTCSTLFLNQTGMKRCGN